MITRSAGMWAAFVLCAAALHAQFADFSNHDTSHKFGTWNLSDDDVPDAEYWSSQAESENFLITVYAHVVIGDNYNIALGDLTPDTTDPDLTISYHMVVLNKITGQKTGPTALDGGNAAYVHLNATLGNPYNVTVEGIIDEASALVALEGFRPAVAFTPRAADPGNPNSAIVAFPQRDATSGAIDIVTIFLVYNSTTDTFTESTTRQKVNVSNSSGNSLHPGLIILDDSIGRGDFVVCWTDDSTAGTIGGSADLPVDNFGFGLTDVYARRYQQEFPSVPGAGATPDDIAVNVSDSDDVDESWVRMTTDHDDRAWVAFVSDGEAGGTNVAGTGAGPTSGTTDVFVCGLDVSATLSRDSARNVSQSAGSSLRPDICYNYDSTADDDVIGLIFLDDSDNGIGGNNSISTRTSLPNPTNPPNAGSKALDTYVRSFTLTGTILSGNQFICDNITYDTDDQRIVHMTPGNGLGFFLGWTTNHYNSTTTEWDSYASYLLEVDEDGDDVGTVLSIPVNTTTTPFELVYDMTVGSDGASLTSVGLSFISTSSSQENLRPGEPNVGGGWDVYAIEGELGGSGTPATVAVSGIKANNGAPIDPFNAPGTIDVVYKVTNTDAVALLTVTGSTITAPLGFTLFGSISPDPSGGILIQPLTSETFTATFTVNSSQLTAGSFPFICEVRGSSNSEDIGDTSAGNITVTGISGNITGVSLSIEITKESGGSPVVTEGVETELRARVVLSNVSGPAAITNIVVSGSFGSGFSPNNFGTMDFSPEPTTTTVQSGGTMVFVATFTALSTADEGTYYPAIVFSVDQGTASGSITAVVSEPITVAVGGIIDDDGEGGDPGSYFETRPNAGITGCALIDSAPVVLFAILSVLFAVAFRTRQRTR